MLSSGFEGIGGGASSLWCVSFSSDFQARLHCGGVAPLIAILLRRALLAFGCRYSTFYRKRDTICTRNPKRCCVAANLYRSRQLNVGYSGGVALGLRGGGAELFTFRAWQVCTSTKVSDVLNNAYQFTKYSLKVAMRWVVVCIVEVDHLGASVGRNKVRRFSLAVQL